LSIANNPINWFNFQALPGNTQRLCLDFCWGKEEAEPPDLRYQAEPGNE